MKMKKTVVIVLSALLILSLAACLTPTPSTAASQTESVSYKEAAVIADSSLRIQLDPQSNNTGVCTRLYMLTSDSLIDLDYSTYEYLPGLATSWDISSDGLTYTFRLREGVTFHNGDPFKSEDVIFTFKRAATKRAQSAKIECVESIEAPDDTTVIFHLKAPNTEFMNSLAYPNLSILSERALTEDPDNGGVVGTGAYVLTEYVPDDRYTVQVNPSYWGEEPLTKAITYRKIREASARTIALQNGEVDINLDQSPIEASYIEGDENCEMLYVDSTKLVYVAFNVNGYNKALKDVRVRKALQMAYNPEDLIIVCKEGHASVTKNFVPSSIPEHSAKIEGYALDLEGAKALLQEAGYGNGLNLTLSFDEALYPGYFEILAAMWSRIGVNLTINTSDSTALNDQIIAGTYDMTIAQWSYSSIDSALRAMFYSGSSSNRSLTADSDLDAMIDKAVATLNDAERFKTYEEIQQHITNSAAVMPLFVDEILISQRKGVSGWKANGNARYELQKVLVPTK